MAVQCTIFTHKDCLLHDTGEGHPEQIARLVVILEALKKPQFQSLVWQEAPKADIGDLCRAHSAEYVREMLQAAPASGYRALDSDTIISPKSIESALRSAGAVVAAVDDVLTGKTKTAFCAVRPPGHHATRDSAMGFCIFSNLAIGGLHAVQVHGLKRVAIVDFDVHHGNGTADIIDGHPEFLFISTHQHPFYPHTGDPLTTGKIGNIVNVPLRPGEGSARFRQVYTEKILPALEDFKPELVLISAGFDAHKDDPLAGLRLTEDDYAWVTRELKKMADKHCEGRIVSVLEGGYNLEALAASVAAHVAALMSC